MENMTHLSRTAVREIDRRAIEEFGLPGIALMENAGRGAAEQIHAAVATGSAVILCGKGNNGGDGYVIARHLELLGWQVAVFSAVPLEDLSGDAAINADVAKRSGIAITCLADAEQAQWREAFGKASVVVDALLGTGASGAPRGAVATAIEAINEVRHASSACTVCAIDLPSGLDCDTGVAAGACVRADLTITFVAPKLGFQEPTAAPFLGRAEVVSIGAPACLLRDAHCLPNS